MSIYPFFFPCLYIYLSIYISITYTYNCVGVHKCTLVPITINAYRSGLKFTPKVKAKDTNLVFGGLSGQHTFSQGAYCKQTNNIFLLRSKRRRINQQSLSITSCTWISTKYAAFSLSVYSPPSQPFGVLHKHWVIVHTCIEKRGECNKGNISFYSAHHQIT